jgi:hypothetical protein
MLVFGDKLKQEQGNCEGRVKDEVESQIKRESKSESRIKGNSEVQVQSERKGDWIKSKGRGKRSWKPLMSRFSVRIIPSIQIQVQDQLLKQDLSK